MLLVHFAKLSHQPDKVILPLSVPQLICTNNPNHFLFMSTTVRRVLALMIGIGIAISIVLKLMVDGLA
jgi:hypothetical protein